MQTNLLLICTCST